MRFLPPGYNVKEIEKSTKNKWRWEWLSEVDYRGNKWGNWLRKPDVAGVAFCECCSKTIKYGSSGKKAVKSHADDLNHQKILRTVKSNEVLPGSSKATKETESLQDRIASQRAIIAAFISEHCLPFSMAEDLLKLGKRLSEDKPALEKTTISRSSATYINTHGLAKNFKDELKQKVKGKMLSLNLDEATNNNNDKILNILIQYYDDDENQIALRHLGSCKQNRATASDIMQSIETILSDYEISWNQVISILMDNCSTMRGVRGGVEALAREKNPNLLDVSGDSVHMINNVAKVLLSHVNENIQPFCMDMYYDIEESPKVREIFNEIQTLMNISSPKHLVRPISSRFLQMQDVCSRFMELLDPLTIYYYSFLSEEEKTRYRWWIFRSWGRVGTTIGGNKVERCGSRQSAMSSFKDLYAEKTGNLWENRNNFKKYPNKFYPLDIDYGQDDEGEIKKISASGSSSRLPKSVQDIVCMIFDVESMKKAMMEFEIDLKKMPLGKLSKKQIESAYKVLTELLNLVENKGTATQILDASNRFYTLIPHDFGMKKPPMLDTKEIIKNKTEMLDNLLEIEVAYSMLKGGDEGEDPVDAHYKKLKTEIQPMDKASEQYKRLVDYVKNTHASTHNMYDLIVEEIFEIKREGEYGRYKPFKELPNRQLLWHGSRTTNFGGILSQGLRIAPPEAPVTGYMFGKGVYFADMVSKSANYCRTSKQDPLGLMILCEVALGNMYECTRAEFIQKLPKGKHSCKGVGKTCPDPSGVYTMPDGTIIPMGKSSNAPIASTSLLYNEFIVYDVAQINMKYLFKMNFKFKW